MLRKAQHRNRQFALAAAAAIVQHGAGELMERR